MEADIVKDLLRVAHHGALLQDAVADIFLAEEHICRNREMAAQHDLLVHGVDAERHRMMRRGEIDGLALPDHVAGSARHDACQQFYQR